MFLERLRARNPELVRAAVRLHQAGLVRANTYLLDLDTLANNAEHIRSAAQGCGVQVYFMAKQFGRNPDASQTLLKAGLPSAVCVDAQCMEAHVRHGIPIGHVGHLVQTNRGTEDAVVAANAEVVTVFSLEAAIRLGQAAQRAGKEQPVLLRVQAPGDTFYFGHGGGFALGDIETIARTIEHIGGLRVVGVTSFPCLLANADRRTVEPTPNLRTIVEAATRLRKAGHSITQINAPGTTSAGTLATLAAAGATHVEPGNALHGTTPLHLFDDNAPELPAIVYVSEVSHLDGDDAYVFAAGYYVDRVLGAYELRAVVGREESALEQTLPVETAPEGAIHYYCILRSARQAGVRVGDSVVFCFRPQTFVTRARTQALAGLRGTRDVDVRPVYDQEARAVDGVS
jgi:predicted amino acid racemase